MKTDNKEERDKSGKGGKWRALTLKERIVLSPSLYLFSIFFLSHFIPAQLTSPLQGLSLNIDLPHLACVWDILLSIIISLRFSSPSFHQKEKKKKKENLNS